MVAVLYSPTYGAGWFSWNSEFPQCLFEPEIVEFVEKHRKEHGSGKNQELENIVKPIAERLYGEKFYCGGGEGLQIEWVREGDRFEISEYDG